MTQASFFISLSGILCHYMSVIEVVAFKRKHLFKLKIHIFLSSTFSWWLILSNTLGVSLCWCNSPCSCCCEDLYWRGAGAVGAGWRWQSTVRTLGVCTQRRHAWLRDNWRCWRPSGAGSVCPPAGGMPILVHAASPTVKSSLLVLPRVTVTALFCCVKHDRECSLQPAERVGGAQPAGVGARPYAGCGHCHEHRWEHRLCCGQGGLWSPLLVSDMFNPSTATVSHITVSQVAWCFVYSAIAFFFFFAGSVYLRLGEL